MSPKLRAFALWTLAMVPLDQLSKDWIRDRVEPDAVRPLLGTFFSITHLRQPGVGFPGWENLPVEVSYAVQLLAAGLLLSLLVRAPSADRLSGTALGLISGGAIGNGIDRFLLDGVMDFLRFDLSFFVFPPFNLADAAILLGVLLLLLDIVASEAEEAGGAPVEVSAVSRPPPDPQPTAETDA